MCPLGYWVQPFSHERFVHVVFEASDMNIMPSKLNHSVLPCTGTMSPFAYISMRPQLLQQAATWKISFSPANFGRNPTGNVQIGTFSVVPLTRPFKPTIPLLVRVKHSSNSSNYCRMAYFAIHWLHLACKRLVFAGSHSARSGFECRRRF